MEKYEQEVRTKLRAVLAKAKAAVGLYRGNQIHDESDAIAVKLAMKVLKVDGDAGCSGRPYGWISIYFEHEHYCFGFSHDHGWHWEEEDPREKYYSKSI